LVLNPNDYEFITAALTMSGGSECCMYVSEELLSNQCSAVFIVMDSSGTLTEEVGFEALTVVVMKTSVFWGIMVRVAY
jgi:hypothetical protein